MDAVRFVICAEPDCRQVFTKIDWDGRLVSSTRVAPEGT
jgi:hypothetical protein